MTNAPERIWAFCYGDDWPELPAYTGGHWWRQVEDKSGGVEYIRADLARPKVKPLVWGEQDRNGGFYCNFPVASGFEGFYQITQLEFGLAEVTVGVVCHEFGGTVIWRGPKDEAKAAAQADYERRILEALE